MIKKIVVEFNDKELRDMLTAKAREVAGEKAGSCAVMISSTGPGREGHRDVVAVEPGRELRATVTFQSKENA